MRVLFDGYFLASKTPSVQSVCRGILESWVSLHPDDDLVVLVRRSTFSHLPEGIRVFETRVWPHALAVWLVLPWLAWRTKANVIVSQNFVPWTTRRRVTFVHDYIFKDHPEWFTVMENMYFRLMLVGARGRVEIVTSSKAEACRISRILAKPVGAVGMGLKEQPVCPIRPAGLPVQRDSFVLAVGRLNSRKNLGTLIAGAALTKAIGPDFPLVLVGPSGGKAEEWPAMAESMVAEGSLILTGRLEEAELWWLYSACSIMAFVSLDEGFGLPPLEAKSAGAHVLVSDIPVLREVLSGECVSYVDPMDPAAIADAIDAHEAGHVCDKGLSPTYSWSEMTRQIRDIVESEARV